MTSRGCRRPGNTWADLNQAAIRKGSQPWISGAFPTAGKACEDASKIHVGLILRPPYSLWDLLDGVLFEVDAQ